MTEHLLIWIGLCLAPAGAFYALRRGVEWFSAVQRRRSARPTPPPDLAQLTARLRRLDEQARRAQSERGLPGRTTRLRTVNLAYDDTLCACCAALGLPEPGPPPLPATVRLQTEAALVQHGVVW